MRFNPVPRKRGSQTTSGGYTTRGADPVTVVINTIREEHSDFTSTSELKGDKVFTWNRDDAPKWVPSKKLHVEEESSTVDPHIRSP
jgi:hypothetical protein